MGHPRSGAPFHSVLVAAKSKEPAAMAASAVTTTMAAAFAIATTTALSAFCHLVLHRGKLFGADIAAGICIDALP